jgi:hypothetical protein
MASDRDEREDSLGEKNDQEKNVEKGAAAEEGAKEKILAAIRRAAAELGRAPSRGELRRITGVSHYRVLAEFRTLREAVREAGLEPNPKGEKISTEDLLADWKRMAEKLGRRPSRAEYVREGKYSAGAFVGRFGSWSGICETPLTTKDTKEHGGKTKISRELTRKTRINQKPEKPNHKGHEGARRTRSGDLVIGRSGDLHPTTRKPRVPWTPGDGKAGASRVLSAAELHSHKRNERSRNSGESMLHNFQCVPLARVPAPVVGMRRVTEEVPQMVVNTLLAPGNWHLAIGQNQNRGFNHKGHEGRERKNETQLEQCNFVDGTALTPRGLYKDRPVMGEPFDRRPMTNAPVNELGVMVLFGMVAAGLGLQVESVQGKFPDCIAKRQVAPGKWQYLRIEFEYESKNFKLHGHDPKGCDVIVCWRHNWKECPAEIEVIELSKLFGM